MTHLSLNFILYVIIGLILGSFYFQMGNDGSSKRTIFNFGFCLACSIVFLYIPMMPVLLKFPTQIKLIKRENFNGWYGIGPYFSAMTLTTFPLQAGLGLLYVLIAYSLTGQPFEFRRIMVFFVVCTLTAFISDSLALVISSVLNIVNSMFVGPVIATPILLLAVQGVGDLRGTLPPIIRISMYFSYLRYAFEGLIYAVYGFERPMLTCPEAEILCPLRDPKGLMLFMGMENIVLWIDFVGLLVCLIVIRFTSFYMLRQRLRPNKTFTYLAFISRIIKSQIGLSR